MLHFYVSTFSAKLLVMCTSPTCKSYLVNRLKLVQIERKFPQVCAAPIAPQVRYGRKPENRGDHVSRAMPGDLPAPEQVVLSEAEHVSLVRCCGASRSGTAHQMSHGRLCRSLLHALLRRLAEYLHDLSIAHRVWRFVGHEWGKVRFDNYVALLWLVWLVWVWKYYDVHATLQTIEIHLTLSHWLRRKNWRQESSKRNQL